MSFFLSNDMNCECNKYEHLTLDRQAISKRIKETKTLKKSLRQLLKAVMVSIG
jgi:hypothetical protein